MLILNAGEEFSACEQNCGCIRKRLDGIIGPHIRMIHFHHCLSVREAIAVIRPNHVEDAAYAAWIDQDQHF